MSRSEHHSALASIVWHETAGVRYVTATGEVDLSNVTALERALHGPQLHVDLSEVTFVDTTVVRTLIQARMAASEFELVVSPALRKLLDLAAVTDLLNVVGEPDPV